MVNAVILPQYQFNLPPKLVATTPARVRDAAKLLVYDTATDTVIFDNFRHLGKYLPHRSLLVLNDTKVLPARAPLTKDTGGKVEVLFLMNETSSAGTVRGLVDRQLTIGQKVWLGRHEFVVVGQVENMFVFRPQFPLRQLSGILQQVGHMPLPPYLRHTKLSEHELRKKYQTVFASHPASVAGVGRRTAR
ncbi:MAG: S-adenosylmethionine:tRNA ribosyltransferase-isomerase [Patescibacteria group bacterium]